ncbi:class II aldolase/adducin family protein [Carboxylicivirga caseinilyticus]|uniref:class II aldolase/adducin family protein n=1 Tax=Carboxylicivirga caseinilyticus TaxID=3417572 RepID=UPI003D34E155|nr:class II aldolase [Marinilabiliaceae bacterium A049]
MNPSLNDLIEISQHYGKNPLYVIAGGGNTSFKDEEKLWIKASGTSLAVIEEDGFVCLSRSKLKTIAEKSYSDDSSKREEEVKNDLHAAILYPADKRPSVETSMHEVIDYAYVIHTHPTLVNALMCSKNAKSMCSELFGDALFIEYTDPGYVLFKKVYDRINTYKADKGVSPKVIFLENHGIFVAANTTQEVREIYDEVFAVLKAQLQSELPDSAASELTDIDMNSIKVAIDKDDQLKLKAYNSDLIHYFITDEKAFEEVAAAYTPDNIVYAKAYYPFLDAEKDAVQLKEFIAQKGYTPKVIAIKGKGIVIAEESEKAIATVLEVFTDMLKIGFYAASFGGPKSMTEEQIAFIDNWEVENYRRKMAKK